MTRRIIYRKKTNKTNKTNKSNKTKKYYKNNKMNKCKKRNVTCKKGGDNSEVNENK